MYTYLEFLSIDIDFLHFSMYRSHHAGMRTPAGERGVLLKQRHTSPNSEGVVTGSGDDRVVEPCYFVVPYLVVCVVFGFLAMGQFYVEWNIEVGLWRTLITIAQGLFAISGAYYFKRTKTTSIITNEFHDLRAILLLCQVSWLVISIQAWWLSLYTTNTFHLHPSGVGLHSNPVADKRYDYLLFSIMIQASIGVPIMLVYLLRYKLAM